MTVIEAFATFKSELELPDRKLKEAAAAQQEIRDRVSQYLDVPNSFLTGSYARHTRIFPLNDIDVFLVRNRSRTGLSTSGTAILPEAALDEVVNAVRKAYPLTATVNKQNRSVNVKIFGQDFGFDLTPAWLRTPDGYWIPNRDNGGWIPSDPDAHASMMTGQNELNGGKLKPLSKMVKHWSRNNYDRLCSFHIELICADIFRTENIDNFQIGMATTLVHLPKYISREWLDPVYGQCRVDKELTQAEASELLVRAQNDGQRAIDALKFESAGHDGKAIDKWKEVFLTGFPQ